MAVRRFIAWLGFSALLITGCASRGGGQGFAAMDASSASCGNGVCDLAAGESCASCDEDCVCKDAVCGDGVCQFEAGETCDGCAQDCGERTECVHAACGDGVLADGEVCDDANEISFDGCSSACQIEGNYKCTAAQPSQCGRPPALIGEIIFSEVMTNPDAVSDEAGEWFEVYNTADDALNLENVELLEVTPLTKTMLTGTIIVPAGGYAVLGVNADEATNGGVAVDGTYADLLFEDTGGEIRLKTGSLVFDSVRYGIGGSIGKAGSTIRVDPSKLETWANDDWQGWCNADGATYGDGDRGTPGVANEPCGAPTVPTSFSAQPALSIPNNTPAGVKSEIEVSVPGCPSLAYVFVNVEIEHDTGSQLHVEIKGPTGVTVVLHDKDQGTPDGLAVSYPDDRVVADGNSLVALSGTDPNGTWELTVADVVSYYAPNTVQQIVSWGLDVYCE